MFGKVYVVPSVVPDLDASDAQFVAEVEDAFTSAGMRSAVEAKAAPALSAGEECCLGLIFINVCAEHFADKTRGKSVADFFRWWRALKMNCGMLAAALYHHDYWVVSRPDAAPPPDWSAYRQKLEWLESTVFVVADLYHAGIPEAVHAKFAAIGARILGLDGLKTELSCLRYHMRADESRQREVVVAHLGSAIPSDWDDWLQKSPPFGKSAAVFVRPRSARWSRSAPKQRLLLSWRLTIHGGRPDGKEADDNLLALVLEVPEVVALPKAVSLEDAVLNLLHREVSLGRPFVLCVRTGEGAEMPPEVVAKQIGPWLAQTVLGYPKEAIFGFEPLVKSRPDLDGRSSYFVARKVADVPVVAPRHLNRLRPGAPVPEAAG